MAVYKRGYQPYTGRLTPEWSRFLIIARYAYRDLLDSKLLLAYLFACYVMPVLCAIWIYLPHNASVIAALGAPGRWLQVDGTFFYRYLSTQASFAFLLTAFIGPGLISRDLANNALPLYLCRPFSRAEYIAGKMAVLAILLSFITWIPGLALFAFQTGLTGFSWAVENWYIAYGLFMGSWLWIAFLCLLALAVSAWVKWRVVAGAVILGMFFVAAGFGAALNEALGMNTGDVFNIVLVMSRIWTDLFGVPARAHIAVETAWMAIFVGGWFFLYLLNRKVRAYEVVK